MNLKQYKKVGLELFRFAMLSKKWWLIPIFVVFALIALLIVLSGSGAAPFIYTIF